MTQITSDQLTIIQNPETILGFLSDLRNFENLMPEQVINWKADKEACSFTIQGMADLGFRIEDIREKQIVYKSEAPSPFPFNLECFCESTEENTTKSYLTLSAELNPFLQMMAKKPLTNFLNMLNQQLKVLMEQNKV